MALNIHTLLITALTLSSGAAVAAPHSAGLPTCGTSVDAQPRVLVGAGIMPANALEYRLSSEHVAALSQPQRDLLLSFEREVFSGGTAPHVCMHPDTSEKVAEAIELFLNDLWNEPTPNSFILSTRWTSTATSGVGLSQGDPTTITYSFIPDGTNIQGEGPSNLITKMNSWIGSGTWETLFATALGEWADISGITYLHETNDDGPTLSGGGPVGVLGVRGDVRIGGNFIDGNSGILAYNYYPNGGDMVIDTGDGGFYSNSSNNYIRLRNVVTHESGHGIGLAHVESDSHRFLMEPYIDISFSGPQTDDIRGAQRGYGDYDENNNSYSFPSNLNTVPPGTFGPFVGGNVKTITLRSMDDNNDIDYYSFTTGEPVTLTAVLSPTGGSYQVTGQGGGGGGSFYNTSAVADLNMKVTDAMATTLMSVDNTGNGGGETLILDLPTPGQYFLVIDGDNTNGIQTYSLAALFATLDVPNPCEADLTGDGQLDFFDISAFLTAFSNGDPIADLTDDGIYDFFDISAYLTLFSMGCP